MHKRRPVHPEILYNGSEPSNGRFIAPRSRKQRIVLGEGVNALFEPSPPLILSLLLHQPMHKSKGQLRQPARLAASSYNSPEQIRNI